MSLPRVTIALITVGGVLKPCLDSVLAQDYPRANLSLVVNAMKPVRFSGNDVVNKYENCHRNRNQARERALATDAEYFLFLDDDIVLPSNAILRLAEQAQEREVTIAISKAMKAFYPGISNRTPKKHVLGGYYPILNTNRYVCGRWVADNTFHNFTAIRPGLVKTDLVGLGCAFISREILEAIDFEAGTDRECLDAATREPLLLGECGAFGNRVHAMEIPMYMSSDVVCHHLIRPEAGDPCQMVAR